MPINDKSCEPSENGGVIWCGIDLKAECWLGQWRWQVGGQNAGGESG